MNNNPLIYTDPTGHFGMPACLSDECHKIVAKAAQDTFDAASPYLDNLNAFGPAGIELNAAINGLGNAVQFTGKAMRAFVAAKAIKDSSRVISAGENVWSYGWSTRGLKIDELLGNNLGRTFPVVDKIENRVVTSVKSYDIQNSYKSDGAWLKQLKTDINKLRDMGDTISGTASDGSWLTLTKSMYDSKVLNIAIPEVNLNANQVDAIQKAIEYAKQYEINITTTIIKE